MDLKVLIIVLVVFIGCNLTNGSSNCPNLKHSLGSIRKRRHLAFPTGSAVTIVASVVKTFMTHVPSGWYLAIEGEMIFKLPDAAFVAAQKRRKLRHRQKREVWELFQTALEVRNINGRACIIRAVCEAKVFLASKGNSLVHDILRAIFTAPLHEEDFLQEIGTSYDELLTTDVCEKSNDCPFSYLSFILDLNKQEQ